MDRKKTGRSFLIFLIREIPETLRRLLKANLKRKRNTKKFKKKKKVTISKTKKYLKNAG